MTETAHKYSELETAASALIKQVYPHIDHDEKITENLFVFIENDMTQKKEYDALCVDFSSYQANQVIGKMIREMYDLPNTGNAKATKTSLINPTTIVMDI